MTAVPPPSDALDQGVPWHYGNPLVEQRALAAGRGTVDLSNRAVLSVSGPDRLTWLHDLTTQQVRDLAPGASALALILGPTGHVEFELHLVDDGETTWIVTEGSAGASLLAYLERMRFLLRVEPADRSDAFAVVWRAGTGSESLAWTVPEPFAGRGFVGREVIVPRAELAASMTSEEPAGTWALEALRVAALMPRIGADTDHKTIPNEVGWLAADGAANAVHLNKGCYRGQETVAKVHNLGKPPRRLALLHLDGTSEQPPRHCDRVFWQGKEVGWIGTGVQHHELGPIATAMVKRNVPTDAQLVVRDVDGHESAASDASATG